MPDLFAEPILIQKIGQQWRRKKRNAERNDHNNKNARNFKNAGHIPVINFPSQIFHPLRTGAGNQIINLYTERYSIW